jgi:two-component system chemotaxis response regulator CheY
MKLSIMLVDDSLIMTRKLEMMVKELGHQVVRVCETGQEAVTAYPTIRPNLVLMDITMPDMDGIEATQRIIAADPNARVIMVTSHGQQAMVVQSLEVGARGYVLKPVAKEKLAAMIDRVLKSTSTQQAAPKPVVRVG